MIKSGVVVDSNVVFRCLWWFDADESEVDECEVLQWIFELQLAVVQ